MSRISLSACAALAILLPASGSLKALADEDVSVMSGNSSSGRRIAMAMPRPKADKSAATALPDLVKWGESNSGDVSVTFSAPTPANVRKTLKQGADALESAKVESCKKLTELAAWLSAMLKTDPVPTLTPVSTPRRLSGKKFSPVPEPNPGDGVKHYVSPEGRIQSVVGR
ncbi:MAG: hypothetical protein K2W95_12345 [Candidatus Obscuribacterales bacterium]|nr:hypothetical protein [Candidatus Obscuribacterales bacterium]